MNKVKEEVLVMEKYIKYIKNFKDIKYMKGIKNTSYTNYLVPIGILLTILGCFLTMVVCSIQGDPAKLYSDFFHNGFWGNLADLTYRALSGNDGRPKVNTVGIFTGTLKCSKQAGMSMIAWGIASIWFYRKNKPKFGLITACPFFFMNLLLLKYFQGFKGKTTTFLYNTSTYSYGAGYKLFILGALLMLVGGIFTYKAIRFEIPQHLKIKKTMKTVLLGWGLVALLYLSNKIAVRDIIITLIFNGVGLYLVVPCLREWSNSDII